MWPPSSHRLGPSMGQKDQQDRLRPSGAGHRDERQQHNYQLSFTSYYTMYHFVSCVVSAIPHHLVCAANTPSVPLICIAKHGIFSLATVCPFNGWASQVSMETTRKESTAWFQAGSEGSTSWLCPREHTVSTFRGQWETKDSECGLSLGTK